MSDTEDMSRVIQLWADKGGCDVEGDSWDVFEIINDQQRPVAWVGPMVCQIEGRA